MDSLDRYYTPVHVAERIVSDHVSKVPVFCVDTTCGTGRLLEAVGRIYKDTQCLGIDKDKLAINRLRKRCPNWYFSNTDIFHSHATKIVRNLPPQCSCDLLVMNPPFSMGKKKSFEVDYLGATYRTSLAMAHVLRSIELFRPKNEALVIVPESLLHSEVDQDARDALRRNYQIDNLFSLDRRTFGGASVGAVVIRISEEGNAEFKEKTKQYGGSRIEVSLTRGGLPVHEYRSCRGGIPYVHTTDLRELLSEGISNLRVVAPITRGRVHGWVILIPRVGLPKMALLKLAKFEQELQLSDCVIALHSPSKTKMQIMKSRIMENWNEFVSIYKGTGAMYVPISRLNKWLDSLNIKTT